MSYKHLAGRLIETQRSMLGESASKIARSVEGIRIDDTGSVTAVTGDKRAVVETLSRKYMDMLGSAAEDRLLAAAGEFEGDLVLPPSLGGPEDTDDRPVREPTTTDHAGVTSTAADGATGAMSDGGTVAVQSPAGTDGAAETDSVDGPTATTGEKVQESVSVADPVKVEYTVASAIPETTDADLGSVYLMPVDDDGWQTPVSVADAVVDALSNATELDGDRIDRFVDAIDPDRLLATLNGENGETVPFHLEGTTVTFHRTGSLAVH